MDKSSHMRARRALLYTPGDDHRKIRKAATLGVDCICMDMEDGVAQNSNNEARRNIVSALQELDFALSERLVRINPVGSSLEIDDLKAVLPARPDGIVLPKVETGEQVSWVSDQITSVENQYRWPQNSICLIAIVETALGIVNLSRIASADPRLQALIFGAEDFAGDIGAQRTPQAWEVFYARSAVLTHAVAYNLQAIDMVTIDFQDLQNLEVEARLGADMGFDGKQIIHPNQVDTVQQVFTPSDEAIRHARELIHAYQEHQQEGRGAFAIDGKMIDAPIIKAAERVLFRAHAAGKI